ncbi:MAG TPA: TonB-dependent receptor [Leptospiraceae bacterium]|nr:TonB-dependent receptor [Leptospiraceae bacterium]HMX30852.1 TonB-dependent receptor [Leptospiraceae bacterium]HMY30075.1 TonB-dependent receptor [Leptospiraceae bacterium]HMZ62738.1 TonB-dependent receptor [Leptospiraceae bacterium]HNA07264.1 TonB-dependent receptor [Leptospiraceae bacterium]
MFFFKFLRKTVVIPLFFFGLLSIVGDGANSNIIYISNFLPYKSKEEATNRDSILENLKNELTAKGFEVRIINGSNSDNLKVAKENNAKFYLSGFYGRKPNGNLILYGHIYNPDKGNIIDALNLSDSLGDVSEVNLPPEEIKIEDNIVIDRFTKKISQKVRFNTARKESPENVDEYVISTSIGKDQGLPVLAVETKSTEDVFKLLRDTEVVTASRTKESLIDVPASTMVITEQDFKNRGYTSLDDIFKDLPGFDYIGQQGTDNAVLYQRGYRTPFTSRTLLMINGVIENDLWAQVATPGRQYPISNIKRVEVIYGPASAVYGPNAFQGIINIITKDGKENNGKAIAGKTSFMYGSGNTWVADGGVTSQIGDLSLALSARKQEGNDANKNQSNYGYNTQYWINNPQIWGPLLFYGSGGKPFGKYSDPVQNWGTIISATYKTLKIGANITDKYEAYGSQYPGDKAQPTAMWGKSGVNVYAENQMDITSKLSSYSLAVYRDSRIYGDWAEADGYGYGAKSYSSYISFTRWNEISKSILVNQNVEYKISDKVKILAGLKVEFKKLTKSYDIPGYWWGSSYVSSIDFLNPNVNKGIDKLFPNGYAIGQSSDPFILKGPSPKNKMPEENTIGTYDRGGFLLSIIDLGKFRFSPGIRYDENSIYGRALNPRITGIYKITDATAFKLLYGEAFNEPSPLNLFGGYSGRTADLKLRPEKAKTTEAIFMTQGKQTLNEFSVYYSRYEDVIKESPQNAGRRRIYGFEYKFRWNVQNFLSNSAPLNFYLYYTYTRALADTYYDHNLKKWQEGTTPLGDYEYLYSNEAKFIPRNREYTNLGDIAPHKINMGINFPIKELFIVNFRGNYVSRREYYSRNPLSDSGPLSTLDTDNVSRRIVQQQDKTLDPYTVFDAGLTINFKDYGFFTLKIMNVFNTSYFHPGTGQANAGNYYYARSLGYDSSILPQPGRTYMVNLTLTF